MSLLGSDQDGTRRDDSSSEPEKPGSDIRAQGAGAVILLVVEDSEMRGYLRGCLVHETTEVSAVLEADSLPTAKRRAADRGVDVIIAEGATVGGSGLQLYRALREESEFKTLPVILMSRVSGTLSSSR